MSRMGVGLTGSPTERVSSTSPSVTNENLNQVTSALRTLNTLRERNMELQRQVSTLTLDFDGKLDTLRKENERLQELYEKCEWEKHDARDDCAELRSRAADRSAQLCILENGCNITRRDCATQVELGTDYTLDELKEIIAECEEGTRQRDALLCENQDLMIRNVALTDEMNSCKQNYDVCKHEYEIVCDHFERLKSGFNAKLQEMVSRALQEEKGANKCVKSTQVKMNAEGMDKSSGTECNKVGVESCGQCASNRDTATRNIGKIGQIMDVNTLEETTQPMQRRVNTSLSGFDWNEGASSNSSSTCSMPSVVQVKSVAPISHVNVHVRSHATRKDRTVFDGGSMIEIARIYTDITCKEELMERIIGQNQWMRDLNFQIVKAYRVTYRDDEYTTAIVNAFDNETQKNFLQRGKILFDLRKCNMYEHVNITQCNCCQRFGHFARNCQYAPACRHCGGCHDTYDCREINPRPRCVNCTFANCNGNTSFNVEHRPTDIRCPYRMRQVDEFKRLDSMHSTNKRFHA